MEVTEANFKIRDLHTWAQERGREHHLIAFEKRADDALLTKHNALASAYFRMADEIERRIRQESAKQ